MKWIALSIFVSSLIICFHYVWINRLEMRTQNLDGVPGVLIINKWTGNNCVLTGGAQLQKAFERYGYENCESNKNGKIILP